MNLETRRMDDRRPPYAAAALVGLAVFALYVVTLAPTTAFWDTSEYIATAHILGIPHPPGNPLFVVLARTWSLLLSPLGLSVAVRVNLFAAATSALAGGLPLPGRPPAARPGAGPAAAVHWPGPRPPRCWRPRRSRCGTSPP